VNASKLGVVCFTRKEACTASRSSGDAGGWRSGSCRLVSVLLRCARQRTRHKGALLGEGYLGARAPGLSAPQNSL